MNLFPVTASTLSENHLRLLLIDHYNLSDNCTCKLFRTGINHTYFIDDNEKKYVFRIYSFGWRTKVEIEAELNLLTVLKNNNISVSYALTDIKDKFIQEINAPEGLRYAVLFTFAKGDKVRFMNEESCASIGAIMAKIHKITSNIRVERIDYNIQTLLKLPYQKATKYFSEDLAEMKFLKSCIADISKTIEDKSNENIYASCVHLDIWYDNMSITDKNEITFFDFDFCGNGISLLDVAYFCMQLFHIETDKNIYEQKVRWFLQGYRSIREISEQEISLIANAGASIWIFYLGVQSERFDWSNIFLSENYLKMYVGKLNSWLDYNKEKNNLSLPTPNRSLGRVS
jgi:Ser/Thr protein kinase RdoA (MazF antagonist)